MEKETYFIREIIGRGKSGRMDSRILAYAVWEARRMMFQEGIPMEEIRVTKTIYPKAAKKYGKTIRAAERQIERLGNMCWENMDKSQREKYLGETESPPAPGEIIILLGCYIEHGKSLREAEKEKFGDIL